MTEDSVKLGMLLAQQTLKSSDLLSHVLGDNTIFAQGIELIPPLTSPPEIPSEIPNFDYHHNNKQRYKIKSRKLSEQTIKRKRQKAQRQARKINRK